MLWADADGIQPAHLRQRSNGLTQHPARKEAVAYTGGMTNGICPSSRGPCSPPINSVKSPRQRINENDIRITGVPSQSRTSISSPSRSNPQGVQVTDIFSPPRPSVGPAESPDKPADNALPVPVVSVQTGNVPRQPEHAAGQYYSCTDKDGEVWPAEPDWPQATAPSFPVHTMPADNGRLHPDIQTTYAEKNGNESSAFPICGAGMSGLSSALQAWERIQY